MSFLERHDGDVLLLVPNERLDEVNGEELIRRIHGFTEGGGRKIVFGLPEVRALSQEEAGIVLLAARRASTGDAEFVVFTSEARYYQMLMTSTPGELLRVFRSEADAMAYFRDEPAQEWELTDRLIETERDERAKRTWVLGCLALVAFAVVLAVWWIKR